MVILTLLPIGIPKLVIVSFSLTHFILVGSDIFVLVCRLGLSIPMASPSLLSVFSRIPVARHHRSMHRSTFVISSGE